MSVDSSRPDASQAAKTPAGTTLAGRLARWQQLFAAPVFPHDEEKTYRARMFNIGYLFCTGWLVVTLIGNVAGGQIHPLISGLHFTALLLGLVPYYWVRRGRLDAGAAIWLAFAFFVATLGLAMLGTIRAPALGLYLILVVCAGFVFGVRMMLLMVVLCSAAVAGLIVAERRRWLPAPDFDVTVTQWVTATAFFACVGGLTLTATRQIRDALERIQREVAMRRRTESELREANLKLEDALHNVKTLKGLLPVCAWCHKVREDKGYWEELESYVTAHSDITITHGICPTCRARMFPQTQKVQAEKSDAASS